MKICLIRPSAPELIDDRIDPPLGLLQIGTILKQAGHAVDLLDFAGGHRPALPEADVYGLTLFTTSYPEAIRIRKAIREISRAPIVVGGPHAQALPQATANDFDYVVCGEAENDIVSLFDLIARRALRTRIVTVRPPADLGALPVNDYSLVDVNSYNRVVEGKRAFSILSGRGCPFRCTYCYTAAQAEPVRVRPLAHIVEELESLDEAFRVDALRFVDDNFLMNKRYFANLVPLLQRYGRPYRVYCRAVDLTEDRCKLLAQSGCRFVACGVESGSQIMHTLMNTGKDVRKMAAGIRAAKRHGISVRAGLIVGFPGETWDTVRESVDNLLKMPFDSYNLFNFVPLPGTRPYHRPWEYGITWLSPNWKDYYMLYGENQASYAFEHKALNRRTLAEMRSFMIEALNQRFKPAINDDNYK